jgi:hypothetical protein
LNNTEGEPGVSEELLRDRSVLAFPLLLAVVASFVISLGRSPLDKPLPAARLPEDARKQVALSRIAAEFTQMPLRFEANEGQTDPRVKFVARGRGYTLFLTSDSAVLALQKPIHPTSESKLVAAKAQTDDKEAGVLRMQLARANSNAQVEGSERLAGISNYFLGNDPRAWRTNVANYAKVRYRNVYPGIDLIYYGRGGELEYDFVVAPGADPRKIEFELSGMRGTHPDARGNLVIPAEGGEVLLRPPVIYQLHGGERREIAGRYAMRGANRAGFELAAYDLALPLVIDPTLSYATYLGGSSTDLGLSVALDKSNNIYVTGSTQSNNFPSLNALSVALRGIQNVFVSKLNANGNTFIYSTYFGGTGTDQGNGIAADATGDAYVVGTTNSKNIPLAGTPFQSQLNGAQNAFVAKFNPSGSALIFSTYLGGNGSDSGNGIALDSAGDAYVAGQTSSTNFPVAAAFQGTLGGVTNGFISKVKPDGTGLVFSTYLGGNASDLASSVALDSSGNAYVTGQTTSANFPIASPLQAALAGPANAFVSEIKTDGSALVFSTFLGGAGNDQGNGIAVDSSGAVYVAGATTSANFPTKAPLQAALEGDQNGFASKIAANGASLAFSTYLGGSNGDRALAVAVNSSGTVYVTGQTRSNDFPTFHPFEPALDGPANAFLSALKNDGSAFVYSTFLGGNGNDSGNSITTNTAGDAVLAGTTQSSNFPLAGPEQNFFAGGSDVFIARVTPAAGPGVLLTPPAIVFPSTNINTAAAPLTVTLTNTGDAALTITSLKFIGANVSAFTQANTCANSVAAGANCTFTINFMPTVGGTLSATIQISDNAVGSPHQITISGTGNAPTPTVALFPPVVTFTGIAVGQTSTAQPVTLTNNGTGPLTITSVQITGNNKDDFSQTNTCGTTVAAAATCTINVTFKPADAGNRQANLLVNDNAPDTPQVTFLVGGESFAVSVSPPAAALTAGEAISTTVTISPGNGFNQAVTLTCTNLPQGAKCSFVPASVTPDGTNQISAALTVTTTVRSGLPGPLGKWMGPRSPLQFAPWLALLAALGLLWPGRKSGRPRVRLGFAGIGILFLFMAGCGGGSSNTGFKPGPTPAGTFNVTVTGTAGKLVQTTTLQLIVN